MDELAIFTRALDLDTPQERAAFLQEACGTNEPLRARVEALLESDRDAGSFLAGSPLGVCSAESPLILERPGTQIGPYKLLEQIGEGGFGIVFMTEQLEPLRRKVALKVLKPGMDTQQVIARFEAERQVLALLDHPNIARVLDAGTTDSGRPFFVMELVRGIPITEFCDQNHVPLDERLKLFISICRAVQHAHLKGIIHRDLKPNNVLVTLHDGTPVVKVIDFGIAKAVGQHLTEKTLFTNFAQLMGTPMYMSPEQASLSGLDIDTRTDIYSLGVLLYELLTGSPPIESERLREAGFDEMRRIIREEEPERPSTRVITLGLAATTISINRQTTPKRLSQLFRGEVDWVVMKCLSKERSLRYESVNALADDLARYLVGQPIEARPPSAAYRFWKFARRNRAATTAAAFVALALVLAAAVSSWQGIRALNAERLTRQSLAAEREAHQLAEANYQKARQAVDRYYTLVSQTTLLDEPGLQPLRKELLEAALKYYQEFLAERAGDARLKVELAATHLRAGKVCQLIDRNDEAIAHLKSGLELVESLLEDPQYAVALKRHLPGVHKAGRTLHGGTRPPSDPLDALRTLERGAHVWEQLAGKHPDTLDFQSDLAGFYLLIGDLQRTLGKRSEGVQAYERATAILETLASRKAATVDYRADLATCYEVLGLLRGSNAGARDFQRSLELREGLATEFPERPEYRLELASAYRVMATQVHADQPQVVQNHLDKSFVLLSQLVAEHPGIPVYEEQLARVQMSRAELYGRTGRFDDAQQAARQALVILESLARRFPRSSHHRENLLQYYRDMLPLLAASGQTQVSEQAWRQIIAIQKGLAAEFATIPRYQEQLAWFLVTCPYTELRDSALAVDSAKKAVAMQPGNGNYWKTLGAAFYRAAETGSAEWALAIEALDKSMELPPGPKGYNQLLLAMALWQSGDPQSGDPDLTPDMRSRQRERARQLYAQAVGWIEKHNADGAKTRRLRAEANLLLGIEEPKPTSQEQPEGKPDLQADPNRD